MSTSSDDDPKYVTADEAAEIIARAGGDYQRILNDIPDYTEEMAAAFEKNGKAGIQEVVDRMVRELKERVSAVKPRFKGQSQSDPAPEFPAATQ